MEGFMNLDFSFTAICMVSWMYATAVGFLAANQEHHSDGMLSFGNSGNAKYTLMRVGRINQGA